MAPSSQRLLSTKYVVSALGAVLFYALTGFFVLPLAIGWYLPRLAQDQFHCLATVGKVRINPFQMRLEVANFILAEADGAPLASFERLLLDLDFSAFFRRTISFSEVHLERPTLHVVFKAGGETNFTRFVPPSHQAEPAPSPDSDPVRLTLQDMALTGGELTIIDQRQSEPATATFRDMDIHFANLSTVRDQVATYSLATATANRESIRVDGEIGLVPFRSFGRVACSGIQAATLWGFIRDALRLDPPSGTVDMSTEYRADGSGASFQLGLERFRVALSGLSLTLAKSEKPFFELSKLELDAARLDLAARSIQGGKILVESGAVGVLIDDSGTPNLSTILATSPGPEDNKAAPGSEQAESPQVTPDEPGPWKVDLDSIEVKDIGVTVEDKSRVSPFVAGAAGLSLSARATIDSDPKAPQVRVQQLAAEVKRVGLGKAGDPAPLCTADRFFVEGGALDLGARTMTVERVGLSDGRIGLGLDEGGNLDLTKLFALREPHASPPESVASLPWKVKAKAVEITDMALAFEDASKAAPVGGGVASIAVSSSLALKTGDPLELVGQGLAVELKGLRLEKKGAKEPVFAAQRFAVNGGEIDLGARMISLPVVALSDGQLAVGLEKDGKLNLEKLFAPKRPPPAVRGKKNAAGASGAPGWKYLVKTFELSRFRCALSDQQANPKKPLYQLQDLRLRATGIDGHSPMPAEVSFTAGQGKTVGVEGKVNPAAMSVDGKVKVVNWPLTPLQPYLAPYITLALQSASMSTEGKIKYGAPKAGAKFVYDGSFSLDKLRLAAPGAKEPYLGWESVQIPNLKLSVEPNNLQIKEVRVKKPLGELIIAEDRTVNLAKILREQPASSVASQSESKRLPAAPSAPKGQPSAQGARSDGGFPFSIGALRVEDGNMTFADFSLQPKFMTKIHSLKGVASRISSSGEALAELNLDGGVDQYGFVKVSGALDLNDIKRSSQVSLAFENVELTSVTPYSGKFAGRSIRSGKLSMNLDYTIDNNQMVGDNKIIVDNLELGEHVDSPDAINLPLDLAVALLKDSHGVIDIGLPVSGDLNDPQFSLGPLIWKAFANLITKAVTAPFRALGALFGSGSEEKLDAVLFEAGKAELLPPEKEKLKKLSDGLQKRPQLRVVVQGQYSVEADGLAFKRRSVRRAVGNLAGEKLAADTDPGPLDIEDGPTRRAMEKIFTERFGASAFADLERGVKEGTIKPREDEVPKADKKAVKKNRFWALVEGAKLYRLVPGAKSPEQSALLAAEMYARLVDSEQLPEQELRQLAVRRTEFVGAELENTYAVPASRITTKEPEAQAGEEGSSVKLSLDTLPPP